MRHKTKQQSRMTTPPTPMMRAKTVPAGFQQRGVGNYAKQRQLIQTKLSVSQPGDRFEQEADRAAEAVMRMRDPAVSVASPGGARPVVQRKCSGCEAEELQRQSGLGSEPIVPGAAFIGGPPPVQRMCTECEEEEEKIQRRQGPGSNEVAGEFAHPTSGGQPLPASERSFFEPRFGADFDQVRIHADARAAEATGSINALAYTKGSDVVFGSGQYRPGTHSGRALLAHELAHVLQQRASGAPMLQRQADPSQVPPGLNLRCVTIPNVSPPAGSLEVFFPIDSSVLTLTAAQNTALDTFVANWHAAGSFDDIRVQGFASNDGLQGRNWTLSCERAEALRAELERRGISRPRISTQAHGASTAAPTDAGNRRAVLHTLPRPTATPSPVTSRPAVGATCPQAVTIEVSRGNDDERECEYEDARIIASIVLDPCACAGGAPIPITIEYFATLFGKSFQDAAQTRRETQASRIGQTFFLREEGTTNDSATLRHSGDIGRPADPDDTLDTRLVLGTTIDCLGGSRSGRVLVTNGSATQQIITWGATADSSGVQAATIDVEQLPIPRRGAATILPPLRSSGSPYPPFPGVPRDNRCSCHPVTGQHQGTNCPVRFLRGSSQVGGP